jgi:hypothetical protein
VALAVHFAVDDGFLAHEGHDRDVFTQPCLAIGDLVAGNLEPLDFRLRDIPAFDDQRLDLVAQFGRDLVITNDRAVL